MILKNLYGVKLFDNALINSMCMASICILLFLSSFQLKGQNANKIDSTYIRLINKLVAEDQEWRSLLRKHFNHEADVTQSHETIVGKINEIDSINYLHLKHIIKEIGYPNYDNVGVSGSHNFWLLIQHQDAHPQFQDSVLTLMKTEVDKQKASPENYAYLTDRVMVNTGKLQVYGTQMELDSTNSTYQPKPVEDREHLNTRRKSMGLSTIEEYIQLMNEVYHGTLKQDKK